MFEFLVQMSLKSAHLMFSSAYIEFFNGAKRQAYKLVVSRDFQIRKQTVNLTMRVITGPSGSTCSMVSRAQPK